MLMFLQLVLDSACRPLHLPYTDMATLTAFDALLFEHTSPDIFLGLCVELIKNA